MAGLSNCTRKLRFPEERKDDSALGHHCPKLTFLEILNVCIPGKIGVDVDPKIFGRGNLRDWELSIARAGDRSRVLNLC